MSIFGDIWNGVKVVIPWIATALPIPGPIGQLAKTAIAGVLGTKPDASNNDIAMAIQGATSDQLIALKSADQQFQLQMAKLGYDDIEKLNALAVQNAADVNQTMQAEDKSEHFLTYSWRPLVGYAVAADVTITGLTVSTAYIRAIFTGEVSGLQYIPQMIMAMSALLGVVLPILGIASWFRGKMQVTQAQGNQNGGQQ